MLWLHYLVGIRHFAKTIRSVFHLYNTSATCKLSVYLDGERLRHECHPTYLGVTLDRMLSYREHLTKTAGKLKNQNNLLMKLASSNTLWTSALALCYSAAEYYAPVLSRSAHTSQVTECSWTLPCASSLAPSVLHLSHGFHCSPPALRRKAATDKLVEKIFIYDSWPIHPDILNRCYDWHPASRCGWTYNNQKSMEA